MDDWWENLDNDDNINPDHEQDLWEYLHGNAQQQNEEDADEFWGVLPQQQQPNEADVIPYFMNQDPAAEFVSTWEHAIANSDLPAPDPMECPSAQFWNLDEENPLEGEIYTAIRENYGFFRTHYLYPRPVQDVFSFRIPLFTSVTVPMLQHWLRLVYLSQQNTFRLDFSFSFLLLRRTEGDDVDDDPTNPQIRSFISSNNSLTFFQSRGPPMITNQTALDEEVIARITDDDLRYNCLLLREDTKWEFLTFLGVTIYATHTNVPIGGRRDILRLNAISGLPQYIIRNMALNLLLKDGVQDNLCFFRAVAAWKSGGGGNRYNELEAKEVFAQFIQRIRDQCEEEDIPPYAKKCRWLAENIRLFPGVQEKEIALCETLFQINVQIWTLTQIGEKQQEKCRACVLRYPAMQYSSLRTMHLLQCDNHFCLILDVDKFAQRYQCSACDKVFSKRNSFQKHWRRGCEQGEPRKRYPSGSAGRKITLWDELAIYCGITVPPSRRFHEYMLTWDIETFNSRLTNDDEEAISVIEKFSFYSWFSEHDYEASKPVKSEGETKLQTFIRLHWKQLRSDRSRRDAWRVRTCVYAAADNPFPLTRDEILTWLVLGASRVSVEQKQDGVNVSTKVQMCVKEAGQYRLVSLNALRFTLDNYAQAEDQARLMMDGEGGTDFEACWDAILNDTIGGQGNDDAAAVEFCGMLAFECAYENAPIRPQDGEMILLSISIAGNVPGIENAFLLNDNDDDWYTEEATKRLVDQFLAHCMKASKIADKLMRTKLRPYLCQMKQIVKDVYHVCRDYASALEDKRSGDKANEEVESVKDALRGQGFDDEEIKHMQSTYSTYKMVRNLYQRLRTFCRRLTVIGFNSGKFDVPVLRNSLLPALLDLHSGQEESAVNVLVHHQRYISITTPALRFLDALSYTSPMKYDVFLKSWGITQVQKLKFPYDAVRSPADLRRPGIPPREQWANWLDAGRGVSDEEWMEIQDQWRVNGFRNLEDCLRKYNEADCTGLLLAAEKIHQFWRETYRLDSFVDGVSLPGLAWESLMKSLPPFTILSLPNPRHFDAQLGAMKKALIAGPSIIFTRYAKAGETAVPSGDLVKSIQGFDVNSLYSYCYTLPMPALIPGLRYRPLFEQDHHQSPPVLQRIVSDNSHRRRSMSTSQDPPPVLEPQVLQNHDDDGDSRSGASTPSALNAFLEGDENEHTLEECLLVGEPMEYFWRAQTEWLTWRTEEFRTKNICQHHEPLGKYFNGKEIRIGGPMGPPVDGICPHCCHVQQFHGCLWHAHENCLNPQMKPDLLSKRLSAEEIDKRRERTRRVEEAVETAREINSRLTYEIMWECEWTRKKRNRSDIREFLQVRFPYYPKCRQLTARQLIDHVRDGTWTGFVTVDCQIRPEYWNEYQRFPTLFFHREVQLSDLKGEMRDYAQRNGLLKRPQKVLVSGMRATEWTVLSPYLQDLLKHRHVEVTRVYEAVWYPLWPVFEPFFQNLQEQRRKAQEAGNSGRSLALKLNANAIYGRSCMNRDTQMETVIVDAETAVAKHVNSPRFRQLQVLQEGKYYQICQSKGSITYDVPYQLAVSCLNYAKISMIRFVWDFVMRFMKQSCRLCFMDTDSIYLALKGQSLEDSLDNPQEDKKAFETAKELFLHDKDPGKLKLELKDGTCYVGLAAKAYTIQRADGRQITKAKGVQRSVANHFSLGVYERALKKQEIIRVHNRGFQMRRRPGELAHRLSMYKIDLTKRGLSFFYQKRNISSSDPDDTVPLEMDP